MLRYKIISKSSFYIVVGAAIMSDFIPNVEFDPSNPDPRCACLLVLDSSFSMRGEPIKQLNLGLQTFQSELQKDAVAQSRVEIAIITFGPVTVATDFTPARDFVAPTLKAKGNTPMGAALDHAIDMLAQRKQLYRTNGVPYYRPWIFLISDGAPTDAWKTVAKRIKTEEQKQSLSVFAVGVAGADMATLAELSVRKPLPLQGYSFREMFMWLSNSLVSVSQSQPGQQVQLAPPASWTAL
jgi:uncharacterized protein YegL